MQKSDLPFGSEFSPSQVELPHLLEVAKKNGGHWKAFEAAVRKAYFESHQTSEYNRNKLANNTKLGMIAYGIIDRDANLTQFGTSLYALKDDHERLYAALATHILKDLNGLTLIQCVQDIQVSGEPVDLIKLWQWLEERGIHFSRGGKHPSMMRLWLEKAGVFTQKWQINERRLEELLGASTRDVETLAGLSSQQKAYIKTLSNLGGPGPHASNEVERMATATYGITFNEKNLPKQVLYPLEKAGYITLTRGTEPSGRGAKPFMITITDKLVAEQIRPILDQLEKQTTADLRPLLRKTLTRILLDLKSKDRHKRGLALEALAFKLMRLIDLTYVATRLRGDATGGAEVDLVFESARLVFSRWQVQCKNTPRVALDDVAKEVGLSAILNGKVIVIVSTGTVDREARKYARIVAKKLPLQFVFIDGNGLRQTAKFPISILTTVAKQCALALQTRSEPALFLGPPQNA